MNFDPAYLPAIAAFIAALLAARSAKRAHDAQASADHLQRLERRVADHKREIYKPMIEMMAKMLDDPGKTPPASEFKKRFGEFARWITVVGSDDAVLAFRNLMQASYNNAPTDIYMRLFAEFQLAARRDLGDEQTALTAIDLMGMRVNDLYGEPRSSLYRALTLPIDEVAAEHGWKIPW